MAPDAARDKKGKGKAKDAPTRALLRRFYPLVLSLPDYLACLLPSQSRLQDAFPIAHAGSQGGPSRTICQRPWWLTQNDADVPLLPALRNRGLSEETAASHHFKALQGLRGVVVCISSSDEAQRLRLIFDAERCYGDDDLVQDFSRGIWDSWEPPDPSRPSQAEGESMSELVRHSQQVIFKRNAGTAPASRLGGQNVLTLGYRPADVRSDALRAVRTGGALTNYYINTLVTRLTTSIEWLALLQSVGPKVFTHMLTTTSLYESVPQSNDCLLQICGRPLQDVPEVIDQILGREERENTEEPRPRPDSAGRTRKRKRKRAKGVSHNDGAVEQRDAIGADQQQRARTQSLAKRSFARVSSVASILSDGQVSSVHVRDRTARPGLGLQTSPKLSRTPSEITLVRSRIFYARPVRTKQGKVHIGLPYIHAVARSADPKNLSKMTALSPTQEARLSKAAKPAVTRMIRPIQAITRQQQDLRVRHLLKYIFPRQHGLHNVFTSAVDRNLTTQAFPDYTLRESEIRARGRCKTPKRLMTVRGLVKTMVRRIDTFDFQRALDRCCATRIPRRKLTQSERAEMAADLSEVHPTKMALQVQRTMEASQLGSSQQVQSSQPLLTQAVDDQPTQNTIVSQGTSIAAKATRQRSKATNAAKPKPRFYKYAISTSQVSYFVYTVLKSVLPEGLIGSRHNLNILIRNAMAFVSGRRYESLTLHEILQGVHISEILWLLPASRRAQAQRPTAAESQLRQELFAELVYWIFDSFLTPLLRTTFYITESAAFRNRTLYFRQDDWATASAPLLDTLKTSLFTPITNREALQIMSGRNLGYSHIRLLPKEVGVRPIVNLRRRSVKQVQQPSASSSAATSGRGPSKTEAYEKFALERSINNILQSTFHILTYERSSQPDMMGSSVFGMNDIFRRLKLLQAEVDQMGKASGADARASRPPLYFVKVDVQAAFDTIEQGKLLDIVRRLLTADDYLIQRFTEVMPAGGKVKKTYVKRACPESKHGTFTELAQELANALRHVVLVDGVLYGYEERQRVLTLLEQHIQGNLVKIGREFFKQKIGIPQGSSLSTLLCSVFYADMERADPNLTPIGMIKHDDHHIADEIDKGKGKGTGSSVSLLMRYTDDFLFISTSRRRAKAFFKTMLRGHPDYGCFISPGKTLANFDLSFPDGSFVPRVREKLVKSRRRPGRGTAATKQGGQMVKVGAQLPWCGILLNTVTLGVSSDLSRYHDLHIADTLTVETGRKPGAALISKLLQSIQSRSHLILVDTGLNGDVGAYINIYHTCLLAALKLLVYVRLIGIDPVKRSSWLAGTLKLAATYQYTTIATRVKGATWSSPPPPPSSSSTAPQHQASSEPRIPSSPTTTTTRPARGAVQCSLRQDHVKWLALHAFRRALVLRQAQWHAVIKLLDAEIASVRPRGGRLRKKSLLLASDVFVPSAQSRAKKQTQGQRQRGAATAKAAVRNAALLGAPERAMRMGGSELLARVRL